MVSDVHAPVLLSDSIRALNIRADGFYIDATFGRGGHSRAILQQLNQQGKLWGCDQDPQALQNNLDHDGNFQLIDCNFETLPQLIEQAGLQGQVNGLLLDLGVSSPQLDDAERGFSFMRNGPLDMRMNPRKGFSVAEWLKTARAEQIADVLYHYGDERKSRRIARSIVYNREKKAITETGQLAEIVRKSLLPNREKHKHPATRSFQALRIFINRELEVLQTLLDAVPTLLAPQGRLEMISFHSLEDRLVKRFIRKQEKGGVEYPPHLPIPISDTPPLLRAIGKQIRATELEIKQNPRSRSAVLRIAEKP